MPEGGFLINCMSPTAPAFETTVGLKEDSAFITARSKAG